MKASFTDIEKKILWGQSAKLALKHNCSKTYVNMIIRDEREINSDLGQKIYQDMQDIISTLSPQPPKDEQKDV